MPQLFYIVLLNVIWFEQWNIVPLHIMLAASTFYCHTGCFEQLFIWCFCRKSKGQELSQPIWALLCGSVQGITYIFLSVCVCCVRVCIYEALWIQQSVASWSWTVVC
jgi:hypothetical protein